jgi:hypothetical protein
MSILVTAITVLTICYAFYKVNHLQFHTNILVLFVFWYIVDYQQIKKTKTSLAPIYWYVGIVSVMQFFYVYFRYVDVNFDALRDIIGLPFFFVCIWTVGRFLEYTLNLRKKPPIVIIKTPPLTIKQHLN